VRRNHLKFHDIQKLFNIGYIPMLVANDVLNAPNTYTLSQFRFIEQAPLVPPAVKREIPAAMHTVASEIKSLINFDDIKDGGMFVWYGDTLAENWPPIVARFNRMAAYLEFNLQHFLEETGDNTTKSMYIAQHIQTSFPIVKNIEHVESSSCVAEQAFNLNLANGKKKEALDICITGIRDILIAVEKMAQSTDLFTIGMHDLEATDVKPEWVQRFMKRYEDVKSEEFSIIVKNVWELETTLTDTASWLNKPLWLLLWWQRGHNELMKTAYTSFIISMLSPGWNIPTMLNFGTGNLVSTRNPTAYPSRTTPVVREPTLTIDNPPPLTIRARAESSLNMSHWPALQRLRTLERCS
jgi:hypothetical protein